MESTVSATSPPRIFGALDPVVEKRPDGVILVRCAKPLPAYPDSWLDRLEHWARAAPERIFLAERAAGGAWRTLIYADAYEKSLRIGAALLARGLSAERPVLILSGNGIDHALLSLAGMAVGAPTCPISTAYSLVSQDLGKLGYAIDLMTPGLVFAAEGRAYERALRKAKERGIEIVVSDDSAEALGATRFASLVDEPISSQALQARASAGPDSIAKFLLTSGSTGAPKAVINTQRMLCSNQAMMREAMVFLEDEPPVLVDWLPWAHTFGSNTISASCSITAARSTSTRAGRRLPASPQPPPICARSRQPSISTCPRGSRRCCRICGRTKRCAEISSRASR